MNMEIKHESFVKIVQKDNGKSFLTILSSRTFKDFISKIEVIAQQATDYGYSDSKVEDDVKSGRDKFIGDLFEIFAEGFLKILSTDNRIGIFDYIPVLSADDNGVDGFGKNIEGNPCTVQIKYRGNPTYKLLERDIKQFPYQSIRNYNVDPNQKNNMFIFTNCEGLHWYTESKVFNNDLNVINGIMISSLIDNNEGFWIGFENIIVNSIKGIGVDRLSERFIQQLDN